MQQGVSILITKHLRKSITSWEPISKRIIKINLTIHGQKVTIFEVYAVNNVIVGEKNDLF